MTDLVATDLTYSFNIKDKVFLGRRGFECRGTISLGDGALTYPSGGIPVTKGKMGLPRFVRSLQVIETNAKGYRFEYDVSAEKLRLFLSPAGTPSGNVTATGNVAASTITLTDNGANVVLDYAIGVNSDALTINASGTGVNVANAITGINAPVFTGDAVAIVGDATSQAALAEASSFAPAAMVLEILAQGY